MSVAVEGSYELTPEWQKDVDQGRTWTSRFVISAAFYAGLLGVLAQFVTNDSGRTAYLVVLGGLLLVEIPVYLRHVQNISWMLVTRHVPRPTQVKLPRYMAYRVSGIQILAYAVVFASVGILACSPFALGGAGGCVLLGMKHLRLGKTPVKVDERVENAA